MAASRIRLDPIDGVFDLRAYHSIGDSSTPLDKEMRDYALVGRVVVSGDTATVTATMGMIPAAAWPDFDAQMRRQGVTQVLWHRHKNGKTIIKRRVIKSELV